MFDQDLKKVLLFIKELTIRTPEGAWINQVAYGRFAMQKLWEHYDGKSEGEKRKHRQGRCSRNVTITMNIPSLLIITSLYFKVTSRCWKGLMLHFKRMTI